MQIHTYIHTYVHTYMQIDAKKELQKMFAEAEEDCMYLYRAYVFVVRIHVFAACMYVFVSCICICIVHMYL